MARLLVNEGESPEDVRRVLKRKLGWSSQKLQRRAKARDEVATDP